MKRIILILAALAAWTAAASPPNRTATEAYVTNKVAQAAADVLADAEDYTDAAVSNLGVRVEAEIATNTADIAALEAGKQDAISDLETIRSGAALGATALQTAPVSSVNGKTGAVSLTASNVGALPTTGGEMTGQLRINQDVSGIPPTPIKETGLLVRLVLPYGDIVSAVYSAREIVLLDGNNAQVAILSLPTTSGTLALLSDIPTVPTTVSSFTNDAGYLTGYTETDPTVPQWAKAQTKPTYTASEVGATTPEDVTAAIREQSLGGIWDEALQVWWTPVMSNGSLTYQATTNVNLNAEN